MREGGREEGRERDRIVGKGEQVIGDVVVSRADSIKKFQK